MIVLYGAGTIGGLIARQLKAKGEQIVFADNDKQKMTVEGIPVHLPETCHKHFPDATWVASVHDPRVTGEIRKHIKEMGVKSVSVYEFTPLGEDRVPLHDLKAVSDVIYADDDKTFRFFWDQVEFRKHRDISKQIPNDDISNVYFEDFYTRLDNEHFVDCGAFDGDTVREFVKRWDKFEKITAFEPDPENYSKLYQSCNHLADCYGLAIGDRDDTVQFVATGDQTAHLTNIGKSVRMVRIDDRTFEVPPTLIKFDIEGCEQEGLWGARNTIRKHAPVLCVCAYHKGCDFWEIPLLIHALNPSYRLYFRRYIEASLEIIWYAIPPRRWK